MAVTMKDVALKAGVSLGTVSNYLSGVTPVSKAKQNAIQSAIDELDYNINYIAQSLKTNKFMYIGVIIPSFGNHLVTSSLPMLEKKLDEANYHMVVLQHSTDSKKLLTHINHLKNRVDGLIIFPEVDGLDEILNKFKNLPPVVLFDAFESEFPCDKINTSVERGSYLATSELLKKGHREIGLIPLTNKFSKTKSIDGYNKAFSENSLTPNPSLVKSLVLYEPNIMGKLDELVNDNPNLSAIVACTYRQSLLVWKFLVSRGLQDKIVIVGHDCSEESTLVNPPLCYTYEKYDDVGVYLSKLMIDRIKNPELPYITLTIEEQISNSVAEFSAE